MSLNSVHPAGFVSQLFLTFLLVVGMLFNYACDTAASRAQDGSAHERVEASPPPLSALEVVEAPASR